MSTFGWNTIYDLQQHISSPSKGVGSDPRHQSHLLPFRDTHQSACSCSSSCPILHTLLDHLCYRCPSWWIPWNGCTPWFRLWLHPNHRSSYQHTVQQMPKVSQLWPQPLITDAVANRVCIVNNTTEPKTVRRNKHLCQACHTTTEDLTTPPVKSHPSPPTNEEAPHSSLFFFWCCLSWPRQHLTWKHPQLVLQSASGSQWRL